MEQKNQFRTAGFGGFHRQDVLDYIERTAKEQSQKREELSKALEEAKKASEEHGIRLTELQNQAEGLQKELDQAKARAESLTQEKESLQQQLDLVLEGDQTVQELRQQLEDCKRQAARYIQLKSDYAEIELSARQRASDRLSQAEEEADACRTAAQTECDRLLAQAKEEAQDIIAKAQAKAESITAQAQNQAELILSKAQDEALHVREERRQLLNRTRRDFDTSAEDLKSSVSGALREVEHLRQGLLDLNTTFEENTRAVEELCSEED